MVHFILLLKAWGTFRVSSEIQVFTHLACYSGWPNAVSAIMIAKEISSTRMLPSKGNSDRKPLADSTANSINQGGPIGKITDNLLSSIHFNILLNSEA
jgi:hypothetical protein